MTKQSTSKVSRLRRLATPAPEQRSRDWKPLIDNGKYEKSQRIESFNMIQAQDKYRKYLLSLSRNLSPISTVTRLDLLHRTVVVRIASHPLPWAVLVAYIAAAVATRLGVDFGDTDLTAFDGGSVSLSQRLMYTLGPHTHGIFAHARSCPGLTHLFSACKS